MSDCARHRDCKVTNVTFTDLIMRVQRRVRQVPLVFCLMILTSYFQAGQSVWSLGIPHQVYIVGTVTSVCDGMGLTKGQTRLCVANRELMPSIRNGARLATEQCEYQFKYRRWNCSVPERDSKAPFRRITGKGTREAAFTYAIAAAGVVHSIARACVGGNLSLCGCSREPRPENLKKDYQWGGCGDNILYGAEVAKQFLTAGEEHKSKDSSKMERTLMNLHNNGVGIQVVSEEARVFCKCHGLSGSCNIKTCQRHIAEIRVIGDLLHKKYDNALRVKMEKKNAMDILQVMKRKKNGGGRRDNAKLRSTHKKPPSDALVFLKDSPNYCVRSGKHEFPGTVGRTCSIESYGTDSCEDLCCGRGHRSAKVTTTHRCKCKFHWCCEIRCDKCTKVEIQHTCR
ncbi:protein Wnt-5a-like isoform X4 [Orbicella faveolata]|uniref:protein Wnt-5a-like isoform X4 n=1 Tax=Orbicella faveolata TaxID=48498 RepID=UPI0009E1BC0E|nr:protein Wnt-5a-like isoform X4 [Orbicella faveolata]